jgi:membrane protease YdiL (CAAX protease family)
VILGSIRFALRDTPSQSVRNLLPDTPAEMAVWVALSATAGFCEETIFRGYLQKQIARMTGSTNAGLVLQALVFGACHGYQGVKPMITITVFGLLFGLLANFVQNLRPGMLAHFLQDTLAGLAGRAILKRLPAG